MSGSRTWRGAAHAKVNLSLRVLAREASGYHQLETVFQALELGDRVEVELRPGPGVALSVTGVEDGELGPDDENLAARAARAFLEAVESRRKGPRRGGEGEGSAERPGVTVTLEKRIPHGAGLGGGSSDAAAVLRGLNELHGGPLEEAELLRLGGDLGADVPFFVAGASRALAWGRGDRLLPLAPLPVREVVVAVPEEGMSTPEAYRLLAEHRERTGAGVASAGLVVERVPVAGPGARGGSEAGVPTEVDPWETVARTAANDFEAAIFPSRPDIEALSDALAGAGARPALMAGSGSAIFGVFSEARAADAAVAEIEERFPGVRVIRTRTAA